MTTKLRDKTLYGVRKEATFGARHCYARAHSWGTNLLEPSTATRHLSLVFGGPSWQPTIWGPVAVAYVFDDAGEDGLARLLSSSEGGGDMGCVRVPKERTEFRATLPRPLVNL
jgi:hypothetical protein